MGRPQTRGRDRQRLPLHLRAAGFIASHSQSQESIRLYLRAGRQLAGEDQVISQENRHLSEALTHNFRGPGTMLRKFFGVIAVIGISAPFLFLQGSRPARTTSSSLCWQPSGYADALVASVKSIVSTSGAHADSVRANIGFLQDAADSVYMVSDSASCRRAAVAVLVYRNQDTTTLYPVLLLKAGAARFVIDDGDSKAGEYRVSYVADTSFAIIGGWAN